MFIKRCLEIVGLSDAEFIEAANGKEALEALKAAPADLLVSDLNMPVMDGETLLKWVQASPKLNGIPVIVVTSAGNPAKEAQLKALGARAVLNKPIAPPALMQALEPILNSWGGSDD